MIAQATIIAQKELAPLLGYPYQRYVEKALAAADISTSCTPDAQVRLWVRSDIPLVTAQTYAQLAQAGQSDAYVIRENDTPLALALPSTWLQDAPLSLEAIIAQLAKQDIYPLDLETSDADTHVAITDAYAYQQALQYMQASIINKHMQAGVIFLSAETVFLSPEVTIGEGTLIYANNVLEGTTKIGAHCTLYPNNRLHNATIGEHTTVESSVAQDCTVGAHTTVGPFAYVRPNSHVGDHCRVGDFVEIKNSSVGNGTKISHLTYVGDSDLGQNINLGCGVVFVNYDGKIKQRSTVDNNAFIGCNCNLVSPVHVGENAYIAAGSTVTEDVPAEALYVARSHGTIKEAWVNKRKASGKL